MRLKQKWNVISLLLILILLIGSVLLLTHYYSQISLKRKYAISAPLFFKDFHDKIIVGLEIDNPTVDCISLTNCRNIVIKNCILRGSRETGIKLYGCRNITIINCHIENVTTAVYALNSTGIKVLDNNVKNIRGPFPRGQMVQFDEVSGSGNRVNYNRCENVAGSSSPEDAINMYKTNGLPTDPVQIIGNLIRGGGPSKNGGGIMLGDKGGSYIIAKRNILVNPGQYGMAIASGTHIVISENTIYSEQKPYSNVGLYVWNQYKLGCAFNTVSFNTVNWINAAGKRNDSWNNNNCGPVAGWETNCWNAEIDSKILPLNLIPTE